ncbi:MAG: FlgD immunoglobulin-like domain containing protein, partial [Candidatus Edwardsbacteria bacterium]
MRNAEWRLMQNYPNPFRQTTSIKYEVGSGNGKNTSYFSLPTSHLSLKIYNIAGQLVRTLVDAKQSTGYYSVKWDGRDENNKSVANGVYFYHLQAGDYASTKKMILLK